MRRCKAAGTIGGPFAQKSLATVLSIAKTSSSTTYLGDRERVIEYGSDLAQFLSDCLTDNPVMQSEQHAEVCRLFSAVLLPKGAAFSGTRHQAYRLKSTEWSRQRHDQKQTDASGTHTMDYRFEQQERKRSVKNYSKRSICFSIQRSTRARR